MTKHSLSHVPFITLTIATITCVLARSPRLQELAQLDRRASAIGWVSRPFTAHIAHWSANHLFWDLTAFLSLGAFCERTGRTRFVTCLIATAAAISFSIRLLQPGITLYRGLSGIDSALLAWLTLSLLRRERGWPRWLSATLLAAFVAKSGFELATGRSLFVDSHAGGFVSSPLAHLVGASVGAIFGMLPIRPFHTEPGPDPSIDLHAGAKRRQGPLENPLGPNAAPPRILTGPTSSAAST